MATNTVDNEVAEPQGKQAVQVFGGGTADGDSTLRALLGGKGANLAEMARIGLPVPAGFTITTKVCTYYYANDKQYPPSLADGVKNAMQKVEDIMGKKFGDPENPLLVSVRSGARDSMPGMMDTILNLGINDEVVEGLAKKTGNERFAWDSYRRFLHMYGDVVMGVQKRKDEHHDPFEVILEQAKEKAGVEGDQDLTAEDWKGVVAGFKALIKERTGSDFPQSPEDQLWGAVGAVFSSWQNDRAKVYRRKYGIPAEWGTAVNVQAMVFGNTGKESGTGVAFTRDPATGENVFYGEYLVDAQGEDVVAGVRTPKPVSEMKNDLPKSFDELCEIRTKLEQHFKDVQDVEFTIEQGKLYMLQTRNGKRTGLAAVNIAVDMVNEGLITKEMALSRIPAEDLSHLLAPIFDPKEEANAKVIGKGLPAGPGAACGKIYFNAEDAVKANDQGAKVVLVRVETSPEDLRGMIAAEGILTSRGGVSSHAALVARQMGKICVCGASDVHIDYETGTVNAGGVTLKEGDYISINGTSGTIYAGELPTAPSQVIQGLIDGDEAARSSDTYKKYDQLMTWADEIRKLGVRTNSDSPGQVRNAIAFGAEGIGLCRTEHMFFEGDRIDAVREMILAENEADRRTALDKLLPYQKEDFTGIFEALEGRPATIRLLDPPLHEFLPPHEEQEALASKMGKDITFVKKRIAELHESNPMLGHRGCRLGNVYPEITEMQARAILEAAAEVQGKGVSVLPEIMVPLVGYDKELEMQKEIIDRVAAEVRSEHGLSEDQLSYMVGTMVEVPRAALTADAVAAHAEFFSFGTNDLTQTTLGMSRDDSAGFMGFYQEAEILPGNPFASLDQTGVGQLVEMGVQKGRSTKSDLKIGICGEHGGDPASVKFCHRTGLNYVSCSPFRIPIAKLAAAQAVIEENAAK